MEEQNCCCCDWFAFKIATKYEKLKDEQSILDLETDYLNTNRSIDNILNQDNCFLKRAEANKYSNNDLYSMQIYEIYLCIHPTVYLDKNKNKLEKSFHPFFYLKLITEDSDDFGVVVQYNVIPRGAKEEQIHLFEKDGVEFIEKPFREFENEIKLIFYRGVGHMIKIEDYTIKYASYQFENQKMTLGEFFRKAIPEKGIWLQKYLMGLQKNCFEFCINTINKIGVNKKSERAIEKVKKNIKKIIDAAKDSKYYEKYVQGFENLFNTITKAGNDN